MTIEEKLRRWYEEADLDRSGSLWPRIAARVETEMGKRSRAHALRRHIATRAGAVTAIVLGLCGASLYFSPRLVVTAYAMMHKSSVNSSGLESVLLNDPGLNSLLHQGSIAPMSLSETRDGIRMSVMGVWTDPSRTVVLYRVDPQFHPRARLTSPWSVVADNSLSLGLEQLNKGNGNLIASPATPLRQYPITLTDQFGVTRRVIAQSGGGNGYGSLQFPPFTSLERDAGLRLTLRIGAVQAVLAPNGPLGKKQIDTRVGEWTFHFGYIPAETPALQLTPNASATIAGNKMIITSVTTTASETVLELDASRSFAPSDDFWVQTPTGSKVLPMNVSTAGTRTEITFPPLRESGTYTLLEESFSGRRPAQTEQGLSWAQPAWNGTKAQLITPDSPTLVLYHGNNWNEAVRKLGYPVLPPAKGYFPAFITVNNTWQPAVSGPTGGPVPTVSMNVRTPSGATIGVTEGRTFPTFLPSFESLPQYRDSLAHSSGGTVLKTVNVGHDTKGYLLSFDNHTLGQRVTRLHWLTVVLPWGNVTFGTTESGASVPSNALVRAARAWLTGQ